MNASVNDKALLAANLAKTDKQVVNEELERAQQAKAGNAPTQGAHAPHPVPTIDLATKQKVVPEIKERLVKVITTQVKQSTGLTGQLFRLIRECGAFDVAVGTFTAAEAVVCRDAKAKSLNAYSKENFDCLASYMAIKSTLINGVRDSEDLAIGLQALWTWNHEKEGAEAKFLPEGYLDAFNGRYADPQKGPTLFMSDLRAAKPALQELGAKQQAYKKAQEKALAEQAAKTAQTQPQATNGADAGMAASRPGGAASDMDKDTLMVLKEFIELFHQVYSRKAVTPVELRQWTYARMADLRTMDAKLASERNTPVDMPAKELVKPGDIPQDEWDSLDAKGKAEYVKAFGEKKAAEAPQGTKVELPEVPTLTKPENMTEEEWNSLNDEEKAIAVADPEADALGDDLTDEDKALIAKHAPQEGPAPHEDVA